MTNWIEQPIKRGRGRPKSLAEGENRRTQVYLDKDTKATLKEAGEGNVSRGARRLSQFWRKLNKFFVDGDKNTKEEK